MQKIRRIGAGIVRGSRIADKMFRLTGIYRIYMNFRVKTLKIVKIFFVFTQWFFSNSLIYIDLDRGSGKQIDFLRGT